MDSKPLGRNVDSTAAQTDTDLGLQARARGDRIGALSHFRTAATAAPSERLNMEIAREEAALGLR